MFFKVLCVLLVISLFQMAPRHRTEVLSGAPKCKKAVMWLMEKMCVFDGLHLRVS